MIAYPEYIIESHLSGTRCVIYDPVSSGEISSFLIDYTQSKQTIREQIQKALYEAEDFLESLER